MPGRKHQRNKHYKKALAERDPNKRDWHLAKAVAAVWGDPSQEPCPVHLVNGQNAETVDNIRHDEALWVGGLVLQEARPMEHGWPTDVDPFAGA